jgi:hypothetical protein
MEMREDQFSRFARALGASAREKVFEIGRDLGLSDQQVQDQCFKGMRIVIVGGGQVSVVEGKGYLDTRIASTRASILRAKKAVHRTGRRWKFFKSGGRYDNNRE